MMSIFNTKALQETKELKRFGKMNAESAHRINKKGQANIDAQLIFDAMKVLGLDIENDREEVIKLCQEIGVEPKVVGIEIEEQAPDINRANIDMPQIDNDGRDEK